MYKVASFAVPQLKQQRASFLLRLFVQQSYMDSEIRAIMAQYMPLDSQNEVHRHVEEES